MSLTTFMAKRFGEIAKVIPGFAFKSNDFGEEGYPVVKIAQINPPRVDLDNCQRISPENIIGLDRFKLEHDDILIAMTGATIGKVGRLKNDCIAYVNQRVAKIDSIDGISDRDFLFYLISTDSNNSQIVELGSGSAQANFSGRDVENLLFNIPDLPTQTRIGAILSALDDKIELNRRTNATLEAIAHAIFMEWFVDFRFPGATGEMQDSELGPIPKGWRTGLFADFVEITGGGTPKTSIKEYWDGDISWFSVVDAPDKSDVFVIDTNKKITQSGIDNSSARVLKEGTTIISARGTVGKVALCGVQMAMNQSCYAINGNQDHSGFYTYFLTRSASSQLEQGANGSVFDTITRNTFEQLTIILPPIELITCFNSLVEPILLRIKEHLHQIAALAQTRDTLLPKLMSGEIEV